MANLGEIPGASVENGDAATAYPDLKALREKKGVSLRDIFEKTRVSVVNLEAIEKRDYDKLPAPVYVRTFIKTYARAIGADSKILLDSYESYLQSLHAPAQTETDALKPFEKQRSINFRRMTWLFFVVIVAGIILFVFSVYDQPETDKISLQAPSPKNQATPDQSIVKPVGPDGPATPAALQTPAAQGVMKQTETPLTPAQQQGALNPGASSPRTDEGPSASVSPGASKKEAGKGYQLIITAREAVWLRIKEDQKPSYQTIMNPGEKIERFASKSFMVDIGNAGGADITFQGKSMGSIGRTGQVVHLKLP